jgi:trans-2,3-dihydro-3-hydroxyanthranilate isomerase
MVTECEVLRVFTRDEFGGNHLGVVLDPSGLSDYDMQAIAGELGFSETVFCDLGGAIPSVRIFTPGAELPFAGHPLVGVAWALNDSRPEPVTRLLCGIGQVGVSVDGDMTWIMAPGDQPVETVTPVPLAGEEAVRVLMPLPYLLVRLGDPNAVARSDLPPTSTGEVYIWAWEEGGQSVKARFFAPGVGVPEDPATGSAAVALAAQLRAGGFSKGSLTIHQGDEIGHPSTIKLRWDQSSASIGGNVVRDEVRQLER